MRIIIALISLSIMSIGFLHQADYKEYNNKAYDFIFQNIPQDQIISFHKQFDLKLPARYNRETYNVINVDLLHEKSVTSYEIVLGNGDICRFYKSKTADGAIEFSPCRIFQFANGTNHCKPHGPEYSNYIHCQNNHIAPDAKLSTAQLAEYSSLF